MNPQIPESAPLVPPGPKAATPTPAPGPDPASGSAPTPGSAPDGPWGGWLSGGSGSHAARKAERRARHEARRAERGLGGSFWGVVLVIVGAGILASELLPGFDWDMAWPAVLIAFGVLLVAASIRRTAADP